jgi:hypothetical protein
MTVFGIVFLPFVWILEHQDQVVVCLATGPQPLPNWVLRSVRSWASSFNFQYLLAIYCQKWRVKKVHFFFSIPFEFSIPLSVLIYCFLIPFIRRHIVISLPTPFLQFLYVKTAPSIPLFHSFTILSPSLFPPLCIAHSLYLSISSSFEFPFFPPTPLHYRNKINLLIPFLYLYHSFPFFFLPILPFSSLDSLATTRWISVGEKRCDLHFYADNPVVILLIKRAYFSSTYFDFNLVPLFRSQIYRKSLQVLL